MYTKLRKFYLVFWAIMLFSASSCAAQLSSDQLLALGGMHISLPFFILLLLLNLFFWLRHERKKKTGQHILQQQMVKIASSNFDLEEKVKDQAQQLQEKERFLAAISANLPGMAYQVVANEEKPFLFVGEGANELLGMPPETILKMGAKTLPFIFEEKQNPELEVKKEYTQQGIGATLVNNVTIDTPEGTKWILNSARLTHFHEGAPVSTGIMTDVTDCMKIEKALKEDQLKLKTIFDNFRDTLLLLRVEDNGDFTIELVNKVVISGLNDLGVEAKIESFSGMALSSFYRNYLRFDEEKIKDTLAYCTIAANENRNVNYLDEVDSPGGKRYYDLVISPVENEDNSYSQIVLSVRDTTEKIKTKQALQENEKRLTTIFDNIADVMFLLKVEPNQQYVVEMVNEALYKFWEKSNIQVEKNALIGMPLDQLFSKYLRYNEETIKISYNYCKIAIEQKRTVSYLRKVPTPIGISYFETIIHPIENADGEYTQLLTTSRNLTSKVTSEQRIAESEKRLSLIYENSKDILMFMRVDAEEKFLIESLNTLGLKALEEFGNKVEMEDLQDLPLEKFFANFLHFEEAKIIDRMKIFLKAIRKDSWSTYIEDVDYPLGKKFFDLTITPVIDARKVCTHVLLTVQDITTKISSEKTLRDSQESLIDLMDYLPGMAYQVKEEEGSFLFVTEGAKKLLGLTPAEIYDQQLGPGDFTSSEHQSLENKYIDEDIRKFITIGLGNTRRSTIPINTSEGLKWLLSHKKLTHYHKGELVSTGIAIDITEKISMQFALQESEQRLSAIYHSTQQQMALFRLEDSGTYTIVSINHSFVKSITRFAQQLTEMDMLGLSLEQFLTSIMKLPEDKIQMRLTLFQQVIETKKEVSYPAKITSKTGQAIFFQAILTPVFNEREECSYILFVSHDVTKEKMAEEKMIAAIMEAENRERQRLAKELHDSLGQTLTAASLNFKFAQNGLVPFDKKLNQKFETGLSFLHDAIQECRNIAHNLMPRAIDDYGYILAIESMLDGIRGTTATQFSFYHNLEEGERLPISQEIALYRISQEAINNSLRHSHAQNVEIQLMKHADILLLTIDDDGKGFDTNKITAKNFGLNSMKTRAKSMNGEFSIESKLNEGIHISVEIPFSPKVITHD